MQRAALWRWQTKTAGLSRWAIAVTPRRGVSCLRPLIDSLKRLQGFGIRQPPCLVVSQDASGLVDPPTRDPACK
jgi:hypothetical protein